MFIGVIINMNKDKILSDIISSSLYEMIDFMNNNQGKLDAKLLDEIVKLWQMKKENSSNNSNLSNN